MPVRVLLRVTPAADVTAHHADPEVVRNAAGFAVQLSARAHKTVSIRSTEQIIRHILYTRYLAPVVITFV